MNDVSVKMLPNYISVIKAKFTLLGLNYTLLDHLSIKYFVRALKINRPLQVPKCHVMDIELLKKFIRGCDAVPHGTLYKAVFLVAYFGFLCLSNIAPHSVMLFDCNRHLTAGDLIFTKIFLKVIIKWSKTIQTRDTIHCITIPCLKGSILSPWSACKAAMLMYLTTPDEPLFQSKVAGAWQPLTDSRVHKCLSRLNAILGFEPNHFTFHSFRRYGATLAFNSHVPLQQIQQHGK